MKKIFIFLTLTGIIFLGALFRFRGIFEGFSAFTYDQGRDFLAVHNLVVNHKLSLLGPTTGLPGVFYGPWWYWFLTPAFFLFGGDPRAGVGLVALLGVFTIILAFLVGKKIGGIFWGLWAAAIVSFSPTFISSSSQMWNPNLLPFLVLFSLWLILKILENPQKSWFFLLGLATGLILEMEASFGIFYLLGTAIFLIIWFRKKLPPFLFGFFLVLLPQIIFDLRHEFLITKAAREAILHPKVYQLALPFGERILARADLFFLVFAKTFALGNKILAFGIFVLGILGFSFFLKTADKKLQKIALVFLIMIVTLFLGFSWYKDIIWEYYLVGLPALALFFLLLSFSLRKPLWLGQVLVVVAVFLVLINLGNNLKKQEKWAGDASVLKNQIEILDFIYQDAQKEKFNVIVYTPPLIDYPYRYLFLWYGQKKYGYQPSPSLEPQKLLYVILEPDVYLPQRRELWLKAREGDGQPLFRQKFLSGLEVEKRIR